MDTEIEIKVYYSEDLRKNTLELSDRRVLWNITCDNFDEDLYCMSVQSAARRFMTQFGVPVYIVGRSGRHVVVEDNRENRKWYRRMVEYVREKQDELIQKLLDDGYAYLAGGNVYFDTSKLDQYYIFNKHNEEDLEVGVREGVKDVRYLTCLLQLADRCAASSDTWYHSECM